MCLTSVHATSEMNYSKWQDVVDSDDESGPGQTSEGSRMDIDQVLALKAAADRTFHAMEDSSSSRRGYSDSLEMYIRIVQELDSNADTPSSTTIETQELLNSCFMNMAAICIGLHHWQLAVGYCNRATLISRYFRQTFRSLSRCNDNMM